MVRGEKNVVVSTGANAVPVVRRRERATVRRLVAIRLMMDDGAVRVQLL